MSVRPVKTSFAEMRHSSDARDPHLLRYYKCSYLIAISGDAWPDDIRLSDIEPGFVCKVWGKRGADQGLTSQPAKSPPA